MKAKVVSIICLFFLGSLFSLSYSIYCDLWMSHQRESVAEKAPTSCHEEPTKSEKGAPAACPILFNLDDEHALAAKDQLRVEKQISQAIVFADVFALAPAVRGEASAPLGQYRWRENLPLYLRNPVLRI
jgi:hypothetical protein